MQLRLLTINDRSSWDALAGRSPFCGFMQSWAWGEFKGFCGQKVFRLGLFDSGVLAGGGVLYAVESSLGTSPLVMPQGPLISWDDFPRAEEQWRLLLAECGNIARQINAPVLRVEPVVSQEKWQKVAGGFARAPVDLVPTPTLVVDIDRTDQEILAQMKPKGRYNIKVSQARGVEVNWGTDQSSLDEFFDLFELTCLRHNFCGESLSFFQQLLSALGSENRVRIYLARYKGVVTSAAVVVFFGHTATYLYGGSLPFLPQAMSGYAVHWAAMRDARGLGCKRYDLYGVAPEGVDAHPYARFTAFKERFGGKRLVTAGAQDLIFYQQFSRQWLKQMEAITVH